MKFLLVAVSALVTASAFTSSPAAFTTQSSAVGGRAFENVVAEGSAHRSRHATIVMDGKANGKSFVRTKNRSAYVCEKVRHPRIVENDFSGLRHSEISKR